MFSRKLRALASISTPSYTPLDEMTGSSISSSKVHQIPRVRKFAWFLGTGCMTLLLALVVLTTGSRQYAFDHIIDAYKKPAVPEFPSIILKFTPEEKYIKGSADQIQSAWAEGFPKGRGFVRVNEGDESKIYAVSAFHQYHCLYLVQKFLTVGLADTSQVTDFEKDHAYHCLEYLRQAVRCSADPTLDPTTYNEDRNSHSSLGWHGSHVCRDYDRLLAWTEENRYNNATEDHGHHM
ncbi:hypothetical protein BP5796_06836 [Coleophoma crateriformis]|uniref:Tat pathway signal sequence n=1 Tax=Coleophoma crateriformis TaxID=565419 RepID=A0A3D8RPT5_9HELO|nr:hypothetical protein BP5796_06836 [Coleophoma crateriformis]